MDILSDEDTSELLENADDVMAKITPKTKSTKKKIKLQEDSKKKTSRRSKNLTKEEIAEICDILENKESELISNVLDNLKSKDFWDCQTGYRKSLSQCMSHKDFIPMTKFIMQDFRKLYIQHSKGTAKYDSLQLAWFQNGAKYLSVGSYSDETINECLTQTTEDIKSDKHFRSCIIANIHRIIFGLCCSAIIEHLSDKKSTKSNTKKDILPDEDHALFKHHGWILLNMKTYASKKNCTLSSKDKCIWLQIQNCLVCTDKSTLPSQLKFVDKGLHGGMTFPTPALLPFMRMADVAFKECASEENQIKFKKNITSIIKLQMHSHTELKKELDERISETVEDVSEDILEKVYKFWIEKHCNSRIKDTILVAAEKLEISQSKKKNSTTQMLRDGLLSSHTKD